MHKIAEKEFELKDFSRDHMSLRSINTLKVIVSELNLWRNAYISKSDKERCAFLAKSEWYGTYIPTKKECWWQMIQLLPSSYNQTRNAMLNYEVLANIYKSRKDHKLDEWQLFCKWIEQLPYSELIVGKQVLEKASEEIDNDIAQPGLKEAA